MVLHLAVGTDLQRHEEPALVALRQHQHRQCVALLHGVKRIAKQPTQPAQRLSHDIQAAMVALAPIPGLEQGRGDAVGGGDARGAPDVLPGRQWQRRVHRLLGVVETCQTRLARQRVDAAPLDRHIVGPQVAFFEDEDFDPQLRRNRAGSAMVRAHLPEQHDRIDAALPHQAAQPTGKVGQRAVVAQRARVLPVHLVAAVEVHLRDRRASSLQRLREVTEKVTHRPLQHQHAAPLRQGAKCGGPVAPVGR